MSEVYEPICVERILVSLDNSPHSSAALNASISLARQFNAELMGIFIEDINLLNLAEMPFRKEVSEYTAIIREITTDGLTRGITVQSRGITRSFQRLINQTDLQANFSVLRGHVTEMIEKESQKCDLIVIGKRGTNPLSRPRIGSTAKALVQNHRKPLLLIEQDNRLGAPMILLYENSPLGRISLETARFLLDPDEPLVILLSEEDYESFLKERKVLNQWSSKHQIVVTIQAYRTQAFAQFIQMIAGLKTGLIILPHQNDSPNYQAVEKYFDEITLPILLIREIDQD